jgi:Arc/MetJ-type ribon-helix-helix transcriptional regulator
MKNVVVPVRLGTALVADVDKLVEKGVYASRGEALREGVRMMLRSQPKFVMGDIVQELREYREKEWADALKQANGDEKKAWHAIVQRANKKAEEWGF